ncbi:MAG: phytase [Rhodospirillaceae bacterium]|nr:phytase [Rhodospirillaceae bacterium]
MRFVLMSSVAASVLLAGCNAEEDKTNRPPPKDPAAVVAATVETVAMKNAGDAADDPAIWIDAADPSRSVIIGTNKKAGLGVYGLDGAELSFRADGRMNNVDIRQNVVLGGRSFDVVVASNRTAKTLDVYKFDGATRTLAPLLQAATAFPDPYGICLYHSAKTGVLYAFMNDSNGTLGQWMISSTDGVKVKADFLRSFMVGEKDSQAEGCAADDRQGLLFVAEEDVGLYAYDAEDLSKARVVIDTVAGGHFTADAEGVAVVYEGEAGGYIMASSQGSNSYNVYDRTAPFAFRGAFVIKDGTASNGAPIDGVEDTDGIDVTSAPLGPAFPGGVFIAQDGANFEGPEKKRALQNFKLVPWPVIREALKLPAPMAEAAPPAAPQ